MDHSDRRMGGGMSESDVPIPPLLQTALVWGLFMGVSSNTRYQIVVGLERLVDTTIAKQIPQVEFLDYLSFPLSSRV